jgi:hypothetical protein
MCAEASRDSAAGGSEVEDPLGWHDQRERRVQERLARALAYISSTRSTCRAGKQAGPRRRQRDWRALFHACTDRGALAQTAVRSHRAPAVCASTRWSVPAPDGLCQHTRACATTGPPKRAQRWRAGGTGGSSQPTEQPRLPTSTRPRPDLAPATAPCWPAAPRVVSENQCPGSTFTHDPRPATPTVGTPRPGAAFLRTAQTGDWTRSPTVTSARTAQHPRRRPAPTALRPPATTSPDPAENETGRWGRAGDGGASMGETTGR